MLYMPTLCSNCAPQIDKCSQVLLLLLHLRIGLRRSLLAEDLQIFQQGIDTHLAL